MKKIKTFFFLFLIVLPVIQSTAQSVWSLERCINYALENNLDIRIQRLQQERAEHDVIQGYSNLLPTFSTNSRFGVSFGRKVDDVTNEIYTDRIVSQRISASTNLTLFAGFRTINNIRYTLAQQTAFRHDTESREHDLILTIANAYLQIMYFEDMLEVAEQQLVISRQKVERTRILLDGGTVSRRDLLEMEAVAAEQEVIFTSTENQLSLSYLELIHLLELDPEEDFRIERPELQIEDVRILYGAGEVLEKAMDVEPTLAAARKRISMAESNLAIVNGERMPTLSLSAGMLTDYSDALTRPVNSNNPSAYAYSHGFGRAVGLKDDEMPVLEKVPYRDQLTANYARRADLILSIPIFNNFRVRTRVQHARIDLDQARIRYENTRNDLSRIIHQAHADATAAYKEYASSNKAMEASRESFSYAEEGFALGRVSTLEYNEAQARLNRAEVNLLQSMYEFVFKVKILEFYQGQGFVL